MCGDGLLGSRAAGSPLPPCFVLSARCGEGDGSGGCRIACPDGDLGGVPLAALPFLRHIDERGGLVADHALAGHPDGAAVLAPPVVVINPDSDRRLGGVGRPGDADDGCAPLRAAVVPSMLTVTGTVNARSGAVAVWCIRSRHVARVSTVHRYDPAGSADGAAHEADPGPGFP